MIKPAGVILAGGRSRRMGVDHKALMTFNGQPLLEHVIKRIQPQLGTLLISGESQSSEFDQFGLPLVPDLLPRHRGPLTGLCSVLQHLAEKGENNGLVLCPCDAPFIPHNLVSRLLDAYQSEDKPVVVISYEGVLQPTFSLWQSQHLPIIHEAVVKQGQGGLKHMLSFLPYTVVEWPPEDPPPFFNVNTPAELKAATEWLD